MKQKVFHSVKWLAMGQALSQLFRLSTTIYVIRLLDQSDLGIIALATAVTGFMEMFSNLGLGASLIRKKEVTKQDLSNVFGLLLLLNLSIVAVLFVSSSLVADFYNRPELSLVLKVLSVGFLVTPLASIPSILMNRSMRFKELSIIGLCASICSALIALYFATNGYAYWSLVFGGISLPIIQCVLTYVVCPVWAVPKISVKESIEHISFGGFVTGAGILWYLYVSIDVAIAGKFWSAELVGIYAVAIQLAVLPLNRILPVLKQVALPSLSKIFAEDKSKLEHYLSRAFRLSMSIIIPMFLGISSVSYEIVHVFLGEKWAASATVLSILCLSAPIRFFIELLTSVVYSSGNSKIVFLNEILVATVMIFGFLFASYSFNNPAALAAVWLFLYPPVACNMYRSFCKAIGIPVTAILKAISLPLGASVCMYGSVMIFTASVGTTLAPANLLGVAALLGVSVYATIMLIADNSILSDYKSFLGSRGE